MAAQGAHITSTVQDIDQPSIFEVLAQESLVQSLQPALQHMFRILAEKNPDRYGQLYIYCDEIFSGLKLILENYYLKRYNSSFSENFYGMKRVSKRIGAADTGEVSHEEAPDGASISSAINPCGLSREEKAKSLLLLVLLPYVKNKCDKMYERLRDHRNDNKANKGSWKRSLCKAFLGVYPVLHFAWQGTMLGFQMAYVFGKSRAHSPLLPLAGVSLQNMSEADMETKPLPPLLLRDKTVLQAVSALGARSLALTAMGLSQGLSVGVFFIQFLEWWYASDQHAASLTALPTPPPPQPLCADSLPKMTALCPLCHRVRVNDTALAVSGFVFCYMCIHNHIAKNGCCPVTNYPASADQLVRLYLPDS